MLGWVGEWRQWAAAAVWFIVLRPAVGGGGVYAAETSPSLARSSPRARMWLEVATCRRRG